MNSSKLFISKAFPTFVAVGMVVYAFIPRLTSAAVQTSLPILQTCSAKPGGCTWSDFLTLMQQLLGFAFFLGSMLAVVSFSYAGFKMLTAAGNDGEISKAKGIFYNVVIGIVVMFMAWLVVNFILVGLGVKAGYTLLIGK